MKALNLYIDRTASSDNHLVRMHVLKYGAGVCTLWTHLFPFLCLGWAAARIVIYVPRRHIG